MFFTILSLVAGAVLGITLIELALVLFAIVIVAITEMVNSSLEAVVDLASPEYHELAKTSKDIAAGAVLVAIIGAAIIGLLVYVPHFLRLIGVA